MAVQPVYGAQQPAYGGQQVVFGAQQPGYTTQQFVAQPMGTQVVVQQPQNGSKIVSSKEGHRTWSSDLLDCFDDRTSCLYTWMCPCFTLAEVSKRMGENVCTACCVPGGVIALRSRLRTLGGIKGSICGDCLMLSFCGLCGIHQMERELYHMGL